MTAPETDWDALLAEISDLNSCLMYQSAETLGSLFLSEWRSRKTQSVSSQYAKSHALFLLAYGDSLYHMQQYQRALVVYQEANDRVTQLPKSRSSLSSPQPGLVLVKMAQCYIQMGEEISAIEALESIPASLLPRAGHLLLAKLYDNAGNEKNAVKSYTTSLRYPTMCLEAALQLVRYRIDHRTVVSLLPTSRMITVDQVTSLLAAFELAAKGHYERALAVLMELENTSYKLNLFLLENKARWQAAMGNFEPAIFVYRQIRSNFPSHSNGFDIFAACLYEYNRTAEISLLCRSLASQRKTPEYYIALAIYWLSVHRTQAISSQAGHDDIATVLELIDKAIELNPRHVNSITLKAHLCLEAGNASAAVNLFAKAGKHSQDYCVYRGVVQSLVKNEQYSFALEQAKAFNSLGVYPPLGKLLLALSLSQPSSKQKRKDHYLDILKTDPRNLSAMIELSCIFVAERKLNDAIELMQRGLNSPRADIFHVGLGYLKLLSSKVDEAMSHFSAAKKQNEAIIIPSDITTLQNPSQLMDRYSEVMRTLNRTCALFSFDQSHLEFHLPVACT
eukprot:TRINITY_DN5366_c0_g1_i2.p1 TRINITY_DN5366_c0_g1~~TRINITY_DN5366_c0_g1_i2.p1  ORF type:complete len:563 (-),score=91.93 TRINITY_DN5366_c0_g1_i2:224-1912(-)